ncbi:hypothetical protein EZJ19_05760 [Parasulfuritortus cantonensis]|uniref:Uncharacterized protein n=1 Tax=Parasulfuritortus cantonensis TaxID=2528202 RepID=A0A4R1BFX0_9PROT|nr:hypothetical protein [Parasulfuritortus cantonensis]TCJ16096.1 hypothetical protein EZJ19_05760 [Parasulfuritortus cantonensis]
MTGNEERIRSLERQLAEAQATLKQIGKALLNFEARECLYLSCEMEVLMEHPTIDDTGAVYRGISAAMGRLGGMAERITEMAMLAHNAAGPDVEETQSVKLMN